MGSSSFGDIFVNTRYPLQFVLAGSGCVGAWNVEDVDPLDIKKVILTNELAATAVFTFTRVTPAPPLAPLADELVYVSVTVGSSAATPLYWTVITEGDLDVIALTREVLPNPLNSQFLFSSSVRKCDVYINLRPNVIVLANSSDTALASLFTDPRSELWAPSSADRLFHNIVWPVPSSSDTAPYRKLRIASAIGDWVWSPIGK